MFRLRVDDGLDLGLLEPRHAALLFSVIDSNRSHLRQWLPWVDGTRSVNDSTTYINATLEMYARSQSLSVGLFAGEVLLGMAGYHLIDWANRRTALGYWLAKRHQGHGYMTRAVKALTSHAFYALGLYRMEIRAATENQRSREVATRCGFQSEGVCRGAEWIHDRFVDHAVYGVTLPEWKR